MPSALLILGFTAFFIYSSIILFLFIGLYRLKIFQSSSRPSVSVVVAARNEEKKLPTCLTAILSQSYPKDLTQIIVVNDRSTDATQEILNNFSRKYPNLHAIHIKEAKNIKSPKKYALSQGIAKAEGELIFTTDADCAPPPEWLEATIPLFHNDVGLVTGAAPFYEQQNLWSKILALDNFAATLVAAGSTGWGIAVTCTGRNLAYRKSVFEEVDGFEHINHSLSGDDDLFLQQVKKNTSWKIAFALNPQTAVYSPAARTLTAFVKQRRRHVSASKYYTHALQIAYFIFNASNAVLFALLIVAFYYQKIFFIVLLLFCLKILIDFIALFEITRKFHKKKLLLLFPIWECFFLVNQLFISPLAFIGKTTWE